MDTTTALLVATGTLAVGILLGWLWHATRASAQGRSQETETVRLRAELDTVRREAAGLRDQVAQERADGERRLTRAEEQAAARLAETRAEADRRLTEVKEDQDRLAQRFKSLAGEVLTSSNKQFLELAEQKLSASTVKNDETLAQREQAFRALLDPLSRTMDKVNQRVDEAEKARREGQSALTEHLRSLEAVNSELRSGTSDLVSALRSNQTRGAWGELQLRRVVEAAGMLDHVDFDVQVHLRTTEGEALVPDMVINLAGGKNVVVDSKAPLSDFQHAQQAGDAKEAERLLDEHVKDLVKHVNALSDKAYWTQFSAAPEFVVMFVPAEPILASAVQRKPDLLETAARKRVLIATPMTLVAMLRTVAYAWQQQAVAEDAQQVLQTGRDLYDRIVAMSRPIAKLGRTLNTATADYNKFVGSLEARVLPSARRMIDLKVTDGTNAVEELKAVEVTTRPLTNAALLDDETQVLVSDPRTEDADDEGRDVASDGDPGAGATPSGDDGLDADRRTDVDSLVEDDRRALEGLPDQDDSAASAAS